MDCKRIYQSEKHSPGFRGSPVYWARGMDLKPSIGDIAWHFEGNKQVTLLSNLKYNHTGYGLDLFTVMSLYKSYFFCPFKK